MVCGLIVIGRCHKYIVTISPPPGQLCSVIHFHNRVFQVSLSRWVLYFSGHTLCSFSSTSDQQGALYLTAFEEISLMERGIDLWQAEEAIRSEIHFYSKFMWTQILQYLRRLHLFFFTERSGVFFVVRTSSCFSDGVLS